MTIVWGQARRVAGPARPAGHRVRPVLDRFVGPDDQLLEVPGAAGGPRIAVTMDRDADGPYVDAPYVQAVLAAGGVPCLVPAGVAPDAVLDAVAGVVVTGGAFDIHPRHYGETVRGPLHDVDEGRTTLELSLCRRALDADIPLLGICGGMQALVVADGGALVQDLPATPAHEQPTDPATPWHEVRLVGWLADVLSVREQVNSTHHQAAARLGDRLTPLGWSPDGVVEAVASASGEAVGVQWHPERLGDVRLYRWLVGRVRARG